METDVKSVDALNLLKQDHRTVEKLFQSWTRLSDATERHQLCRQICQELTVHSQMEEQCFYPEVRTMAGLEDMVDESLREHGHVKQLCAELESMQAGDARLSAQMGELQRAVEHHVKEEEREMFPKVRETCDQQWLLSLGLAMQQQKTQLTQQVTMPGEQRIREDVRQPSRSESWR
ncbi:MAG TPA: hemerythrin domain-containing protein [Chloroflexota bacterium]|nr:hemerythrin domain-containing protein [Chloroflexota bacterium]